MEALEILVKEYAAANNLDYGVFQNNLIIAFVEALKAIAESNNVTVEKVVMSLAAGDEKLLVLIKKYLDFALKNVLNKGVVA